VKGHIGAHLGRSCHRKANSRVPQDVLGGHEPALTVVVRDLHDESWSLRLKLALLATA